ncbi:MAG: hypothetical protein JW940_13750 [Polyangiaceae bacterium]|nr:hypothetical protein [Polyangiaceae bacterium]
MSTSRGPLSFATRIPVVGLARLSVKWSPGAVRLYVNESLVEIQRVRLRGRRAPVVVRGRGVRVTRARLYRGNVSSKTLASIGGGQTSQHLSSRNGPTKALARSAANGPDNVSLPSLEGNAFSGEALSSDGGLWDETAWGVDAQWLRCDEDGDNCQDILDGPPYFYYPLVPEDVGSRIKVRATASNNQGTTDADSPLSAVVGEPRPPVSLGPAAVIADGDGSAHVGEWLYVDPGPWQGAEPLGFDYQWFSCVDDDCTELEGITDSAYMPTSTDAGKSFKVRITATNDVGTETVWAESDVVANPRAPVPANQPAIYGNAVVGEELSADLGWWQGADPIDLAAQWLSCDASDCSEIVGATESTYQVSSGDIGRSLRIRVTASNPVGSTDATSEPTEMVPAVPPDNTSRPTVSGSLEAGGTLVASHGTWTPSEDLNYAYQWQRCDEHGADCADLQGATSPSLIPEPADLDLTFRVVVTAETGAGGTASAASAVVGGFTVAVEGTPTEGTQLTATPRDWRGSDPVTFSYQWQRCEQGGAACEDVADGHGRWRAVSNADLGMRLRVLATAEVSGSSIETTSALSAVITERAPTGNPPVVHGQPVQGHQLSAELGDWFPEEIAVAIEWRRCDDSGADCTVISGSTQRNYLVTADDVGGTLRVAASATTSGGSTTEISSPTRVVTAPTLLNNEAPTVSLSSGDGGSVLTADPGVWTGEGSISYAFQWQGCTDAGTDCRNVIGATGKRYELHKGDISTRLRVLVTARDDSAMSTAVSTPSQTIEAGSPTSETPPSIVGSDLLGNLLTAETGTWSGVGPLDLAVQWERCNSVGAECVSIAGATELEFALSANDIGSTVRVRVTASNASGSAPATSEVTAPVEQMTGDGPELVSDPTVTGDTQVGEELTATGGIWSGSGSVALSYQWEACDATGQQCSPVAGATSQTYTTSEADVGRTVGLIVVARDETGIASASTVTPRTIRSAGGPGSDTLPSLTGLARRGQTLSASNGSWTTSSPVSYTYQWQACTEAIDGCVDIEGATDPTYTLTEDDVQLSIRAAVTASDSGGQTTAVSEASAVVAATTPVNLQLPVASGGDRVGDVLSIAPGSWDGTAPLAHSYQWRRCDLAGANCADIAGATSTTYELVSDDAMHTLRTAVTTSSSDGALTVASQATVPISEADGPEPTSVPEITGLPRAGESLELSDGEWETPAPTGFEYQWQRCGRQLTECTNIAGTTDSTYTATDSDAGHRLRAAVTADGAGGDAVALAQATALIDPRLTPDPNGGDLHNLAPPTISGELRQGQTVFADPGSWEASSPISYAYQWRECDAVGRNCTSIGGATEATHELQDAGGTVRVLVTASTLGARRVMTSAATAVTEQDESLAASAAGPARTERREAAATAPRSALAEEDSRPLNSVPPTLTGSAQVGSLLHVNDGDWTGVSSFDREWERCDSFGHECAPISEASGSLRLSRADIGSTIRFLLTATNDWGSVTVRSAPTDVIPPAAPLASVTPPAIPWWTTLAFGATIQPTAGTWAGFPEVSTQWERCDPLTADPENGELECADILGANQRTYRPQADDVGFKLRVKETATTPEDTQTAVSSPSAAWVQDSLRSDGPSFTGQAVVGETITANSGVTSRAGLPTVVEYTFLRVEDDESETELQQSGSPNYTIAGPDLGHALRVQMTITVERSDLAMVVATLQGTVTTPVIDTPPINDEVPSFTGDLWAGATVHASPGTWHGGGGPLSYSYQWQRCNATGGACADIDAATQSDYRLVSGDVGSTVRVQVTAARGSAETAAESEPSSPITGATTPANSEPPTISGEAQEFGTLRAAPGSWDGSEPFEYGYQWQRCTQVPGSDCVDIPGATESTLSLGPTGVGESVRVVVTATNDGGDAQATSARTDIVAPAPAPDLLEMPSLSLIGPAESGSTVTSDGGSWTHARAAELVYQWQRCAPLGTSCSDIDEGAESSYDLTDGDIGSRLQVEVTASNSAGETTATSELGPVVGPSTGSADGKMVYLNAERNRMYLAARDGSDQTEIASCQSLTGANGCTLRAPVLSPNLKMVAVEARAPTVARAQGNIYLTQYDGTGSRQLVTGSDPTWSSDSAQVAYTSPSLDGLPGTDIGLVRADGSATPNPVRLTTAPGSWQEPDLSPDGESLTYVGKAPGASRSGLYIADADGANATHLDTGTEINDALSPQFSSSGSTVLFTANTGTDDTAQALQARRSATASSSGGFDIGFLIESLFGLWEMAVNGENLHPITRRDPNDRETYGRASSCDDLTSSRRSATITNHGFGVTIDYGPPTIWTMRSDGADPKPGPSGVDPDVACRAQRRAERRLAHRFRPLLRFDTGEHWRPLDVSRFFLTTPLDLCNSNGCTSLAESELALPEWNIEETVMNDPRGSRSHPEVHRTPRQDCGVYTYSDLYECPTQDGAMYYQVTSQGGPGDLQYINYWMFYRFNNVPGGLLARVFGGPNLRHEGDWESVTVAVAPSHPRRFLYAAFSAHGHTYRYLRNILRCGSAQTDCGSSDTRVNSYVASGTHANYPFTCSGVTAATCNQTDTSLDGVWSRPEAGHDGATEWELDWRDSALRRLPSPSQSAWVDFMGNWNENHGAGVYSPAAPREKDNYRRYSMPWAEVTHTERTGEEGGDVVWCGPGGCVPTETNGFGARARASSLVEDRDISSTTACGSWNGPGIAASVCDPRQLSTAPASELLAPRRGPVVRAGNRVAARTQGVAQLMGPSLRPGEQVAVSNVAPDAQLRIRLADRGQSVVSTFSGVRVPLGRTGTIKVGHTPADTVLKLPDGRHVRPVSVGHGSQLRKPRMRLVSATQRTLQVRIRSRSRFVVLEQANRCNGKALTRRPVTVGTRHVRTVRIRRHRRGDILRVRALSRTGASSTSTCRRLQR